MDALEYKSFTFTAYHHVKKIPQPLSMQEILDVISPYLQPSTYFMQMSRVHGIFVCGPLQSFVVNVCTLKTECLPREVNPIPGRSRSAPDQGGYEILVRGYLSRYPLVGR